MEDEKTQEEVVEQKDEVQVPQISEEQKKINEENEKSVTDAQDLADDIFEKYITDSEFPYMTVELLPQMLDSKIKILRGRSKLWDEVEKATEAFYKTSINKLELQEDVEEIKE